MITQLRREKIPILAALGLQAYPRARELHMIQSNEKTHTCPDCGEEAIILVDIETGSTPETDESGNKQYHCPSCHKTFAVDADGRVVQPPPDEKQ